MEPPLFHVQERWDHRRSLAYLPFFACWRWVLSRTKDNRCLFEAPPSQPHRSVFHKTKFCAFRSETVHLSCADFRATIVDFVISITVISKRSADDGSRRSAIDDSKREALIHEYPRSRDTWMNIAGKAKQFLWFGNECCVEQTILRQMYLRQKAQR